MGDIVPVDKAQAAAAASQALTLVGLPLTQEEYEERIKGVSEGRLG
jgi:hypothetical protein